jgi:hypothetical protein
VIYERIEVKHHLHECPQCGKMFGCLYKKCDTKNIEGKVVSFPFLWCQHCRPWSDVYQHWREIRQTGFTEIVVKPKGNQKILRIENAPTKE